MFLFILGLLIGSLVGVSMMCLFSINKLDGITDERK